MRAKRSKRRKNPVLTSPWKIGLFVALMLLVTGFGVGYYLARIYGINPAWLRPDTSRWIVDSYEFFKEMYPLAAGVVVIALCSYFVIASSVRRYRHFLDSGQDYRRMISLAGSIDDLTNPAQIARLSRFPELQSVLRNYGDQIREISAQLYEKERVDGSAELAGHIESVLAGNPVSDNLSEETWWTPLVRRVEAAMRESARTAGESADRGEETRRAASRAALACGRVMESAAGASEDIVEIITVAGRLGESARQLGRSAGAASDPARCLPAEGEIATIMQAVRGLEESGREMYRFSEESNGHALTIALMAARGNVNEHDLAQCAEKVRMTAEQFGKLGRRLEELSKSLAGGCRSIVSQAGAGPAAGPASEDQSEIFAALAARIEQCSGMLQDKLIALGNDVEEVGSALRSAGVEVPSAMEAGAADPGAPLSGDRQPAAVDTAAFGDAEAPAAGPAARGQDAPAAGAAQGAAGPGPERQKEGPDGETGMIVNFGAGSEGGSAEAEERLVIDSQGAQGISAAPGDSFWEDDAAEADDQTPQRTETDMRPEKPGATPRVEDEGIRDMPAAQAAAGPLGTACAGTGNAAGSETAAAAAPAADERAGGTDPEHGGRGKEWMGMPGHRWVDAAGRQEAADGGADAEPIYDLFELGAVECVEETEKIL